MATEPRGPSRRQALRLTAVAGIGAVLGGGAVRELIRRARLHRVQVTRTQLGTAVTITVVHPDAEEARRTLEAAFAEIERLESVLSRHRPGTALARLNRDGALADAPMELVAVVGRAIEYARLTDGAFDPTVAPLLDLYTRRATASGPLPAAEGTAGGLDPEARAALARVGWENLRLSGSAVALARPGMAITLDGIAKGYVVDRAVATLEGRGADRVIVDAGGDMGSAMTGDDEPWRVAIQDPDDARGALGVVALHGESIASSGDYMQSFTPDRSLHHILDPRTGLSPREASAVTVVAGTAMDADALSTSVLVLGPAAGIALLDRLDGVEGMVLTKAGELVTSRGFARHVAT